MRARGKPRYALSSISGERSEQLTELLQSKDPEVRAAAIRGIAGPDEVDPGPWPEPRPRPFP
jgi:hypothetical protein